MMHHFNEMAILFLAAVAAGSVVLLFPDFMKRFHRMLLALSGSFLLGMTMLHIFPEGYSAGGAKVGIFVIVGFLLQMILEYFSGGLEHGHVHNPAQTHKHSGKIYWMLLVSLCIHAITESMPLSFHDHLHHEAHTGYLSAIVLHNIPVSMALVGVVLGSNGGKKQAFLFLIIFALAAPLGMWLSHSIASGSEQAEWFPIIMGLAGGIILHVSTTILLENSENHRFNLIKFSIVIAGFALAFFTLHQH
jgi:zinc and cadmium transporter